jgi:CheY-like chemotaxis protein
MPLKILIVDDEVSNCLIINSILSSAGYETVVARNGAEAVAIFEKEIPDIVLMDVMMPVMDGYEATKTIKKLAGGQLVPVIFLTAVDDEQGLARCVECGGDDFINKPYNHVILKAKVDAMARLSQLHSTVLTQHNELEYHQERLLREQNVAKTIFSNIAHAGCLNSPNIKYMLSPMAIFNGDLLLAARKPSGGMYVMLGDFTGHGLSAAIGAIPVADIFYRMTAKGFGIDELVAEINNKLRNVLPTGIFCAAAIIEVDSVEHRLLVWNGGLPDILVCKNNQGISHRLESMHLPLGVVGNGSLDKKIHSISISQGDSLYLYTDGVIEAWNIDGEMFGQKRLEGHLTSSPGEMGRFDAICQDLEGFIGGQSHSDDITLIEILCDEERETDIVPNQIINEGLMPPMTWRMTLDLKADALRTFDPLPLLTHLVVEIQGLRKSRDHLYTVLAELFFNALDHGLLNLDSAIKSTPQGFMEYYEKRQNDLVNLQEGQIKIIFEHLPAGNGGKLLIRIEDTGRGFDYHKAVPRLRENLAPSGRGIPLVRSLCENVSYFDKGNIVEAIYSWYS